ncbi:MAG: NUDIX hydrolase [Deltaproteobacteria bacterium]|nr:NUDIX hydrolase [Deltaproteobacteria bacterium]
MTNPQQAPRLAATVLLFRPTPKGLLEVFLVKRHGRSGFMAGAHVFPGGRVDDSDEEFFDVLSDVEREQVKILTEGESNARRGAAFVYAAIRETAEECGVLLANNEQAAATTKEADDVFMALRSGASFREEIARLKLRVDISLLRSFSWWLTPKEEPKRYDTRFFVALAPEGHEARPDEKETTEGAWMTPQAALSAYGKGDIVLAPPTLVTLEDLVGVRSIDEVSERSMRPLRCLCPALLHENNALVLALPGDALHDDKEAAFANRTRVVMSADGHFSSAFMPAE